MSIPDFLKRLLHDLSEENYDHKFSAYRFWIEVGTAHGGIPYDQLDNDILNNTRPDLLNPPPDPSPFGRHPGYWTPMTGPTNVFSGKLIHSNARLLLRFISDAELDPALSTYAIGLHDRLCHRFLEQFFRLILHYLPEKTPEGPTSDQSCHFYTMVNLIAHWVDLGYVELEDVRDRILQSLTSQPIVHPHQLNSLAILLKISGATFAAYVDSSVINRCCNLLKSGNFGSVPATELAKEVSELWESGWKGFPPPPTLPNAKPTTTLPKSQSPAVTPVATSLVLPGVVEQSQTHTLPSPGFPSDTSPNSSVPPSPSTSIAAFSDFTIADSLGDEPSLEPETITAHDMFYLDDRSVEVVCGKTLFRVHTSTLSFHSPVFRQMFSPENLTTAESPNECSRIVSSDTPADFAALLKAIYLPGFPERNKVPDFSTFSSLLRVSTKYEMPNLRAQLLETIYNAYPENFEALDPSGPLGENVFSGKKPHPNAVLNLFAQQNVTSALPMAYYMAARKGLDSLTDSRLSSSAALTSQILMSAIRGLMALQAMELKETHRIVFALKDATKPVGCSSADCPSRNSRGPLDTGIVRAYQQVFDRITGSAVGGTRILQALSVTEIAGDTNPKFCQVCVEKVQVAHAEVRRKAWETLPEVFGLKA